MRFYKGTDQYVVAVTAREEVRVWFGLVGLVGLVGGHRENRNVLIIWIGW